MEVYSEKLMKDRTIQNYIRGAILSSTTYGGDDMMACAAYIQSKVSNATNMPFHSIIAGPAAPSGSYVCNNVYKYWAYSIAAADFGWNYYIV